MLKLNKNSLPDLTELNLTGLAIDSRKVKPGNLFAALPGFKVDGTTFIPQALENGATVLLVPDDYQPINVPATVQVFYSDNPRRDTALLAGQFYQPQPDKIIGITGTNGKTSVTDYCFQVFSNLGYNAVGVSTLGIHKKEGIDDSGDITTPDVITMHETARQLAKSGTTHMAVEISSMGLEQFRTHGLSYSVGVFTNLTPDHLDFYPTMEKYLAAKLILFEDLIPAGQPAILNKSMQVYDKVAAVCTSRNLKIITYGTPEADVYLQADQLSISGQVYHADFSLLLPFQLENLSAAASVALSLGETPKKISEALHTIHEVPGRNEVIATLQNGARIIVDYAHTGDALANLLANTRPLTKGKLRVVFGCGGGKDPTRRTTMGEAAKENADVVYVTDGDWRHEDPADIRKTILEACPMAQEIPDRATAIAHAIEELEQDDVLIIAGKGHETIIAQDGKETPYSDKETALQILTKKGISCHK